MGAIKPAEMLVVGTKQLQTNDLFMINTENEQ